MAASQRTSSVSQLVSHTGEEGYSGFVLVLGLSQWPDENEFSVREWARWLPHRMSAQLLPHKLFPPQPPFAFSFLPSFLLPASPVPSSIPCNEFQTISLPFLFLARQLPLATGKELSWPLFCLQSLYSSWHGIYSICWMSNQRPPWTVDVS